MSSIIDIYLAYLLQQLSTVQDPLQKTRILRELAVYLADDEQFEDTIDSLIRAELELHKIMPLIRDQISEIYAGNSQEYDKELYELYVDILKLISVKEREIIEAIAKMYSRPENVER